MHDTILLSKISQGLDKCCKQGKISKINRMSVIVNKNSHINPYNLLEYLKNYNENLIDICTEIKVEIGDLPDETAIIRNIEGDSIE
ncbi:hypothetical protein ACJDU8_00130 [Clostridium sp. WILCCON 0269]|uniref:Hydrogenase maturation nickel metallochaperone HypA n=1 Tax=Candidatus Clostridium eludens TaxID=3381663 RepID=A0ABW8SFI6_9CLOT